MRRESAFGLKQTSWVKSPYRIAVTTGLSAFGVCSTRRMRAEICLRENSRTVWIQAVRRFERTADCVDDLLISERVDRVADATLAQGIPASVPSPADDVKPARCGLKKDDP